MSSIEAALKELHQLGGDRALFDEIRCKGVLADRLASDPGRATAALTVLRAGIAARLRAATQALARETVDRETALLVREHAVAPQLAAEAIAAWARTLGLDVARKDFGGNGRAGLIEWLTADRKRGWALAGAVVLGFGLWHWQGSNDDWTTFGLTPQRADQLESIDLVRQAINAVGYTRIKQRSDAGSPLGQALDCYARVYAVGVERDLKGANDLCTKAATQKQAIAELMLFYQYYNGWGVDRDNKAAEGHLRLAADLKDPRAAFSLSRVYQGQMFTPSDNAPGEENNRKAFAWGMKAAAANLPSGLDNMGDIYSKGIGTQTDPAKAFEYYKASAEAGYNWGLFDAGYCYDLGVGTTTDKTTAANFYKRASDAGIGVASRNLGIMYRDGELGVADIDTAVRYFRLAVSQGNADSANLILKLGREP